jgi:hypothetical protein
MPPSTVKVAPVTWLDSALARKSAAFTTSRGCASLQEKARDVTSSEEEGPEIVFEPDADLEQQQRPQA